MRKPGIILGVLAGMFLPSGMVLAAGPDRPLELTPEQFAQLQQIQAEPAHEALMDLHASYSSEREERVEADRLANDVSSGAMLAAWPVALTWLLIAAAPL
jgi:hypothetical protein